MKLMNAFVGIENNCEICNRSAGQPEFSLSEPGSRRPCVSADSLDLAGKEWPFCTNKEHMSKTHSVAGTLGGPHVAVRCERKSVLPEEGDLWTAAHVHM